MSRRTIGILTVMMAFMVLGAQCDNCDPEPDPPPVDPDPRPKVGYSCVPGDCDDGNPCNGRESCSNDQYDRCMPGVPACPPVDADDVKMVCVPTGTTFECKPCIPDSNGEYPDYDGDTFACNDDRECNDSDADINRDKDEVCVPSDRTAAANWKDENCNLPTTYGTENAPDLDGDGALNPFCIAVQHEFVDGSYRVQQIYTAADAAVGAPPIDCDDSDQERSPDIASEDCDGKDNDCNGEIDDGIGEAYFADCDGDGLPAYNWLSVTDCGDPPFGGADPLGCPGGGGQWIAASSVSGTDCSDNDPADAARVCNPELGEQRDCTGSCDASTGLALQFSNQHSSFVQKCEDSSCDYGVCNTRGSFAGWPLIAQDDVFPGTNESLETGDVDIMWTFLTLPPGSYQLEFLYEASNGTNEIVDETVRMVAQFVSEVMNESTPPGGSFTAFGDPFENRTTILNGQTPGQSFNLSVSYNETVCRVVRIHVTVDGGVKNRSLYAGLFTLHKLD